MAMPNHRSPSDDAMHELILSYYFYVDNNMKILKVFEKEFSLPRELSILCGYEISMPFKILL